MKTVQISLNSIDKVKSFVNDITKFDYDFDLVSGRYVIDAKSIMGIFSLDLSKPIDLNIHAEDNAEEVLPPDLLPGQNRREDDGEKEGDDSHRHNQQNGILHGGDEFDVAHQRLKVGHAHKGLRGRVGSPLEEGHAEDIQSGQNHEEKK